MLENYSNNKLLPSSDIIRMNLTSKEPVYFADYPMVATEVNLHVPKQNSSVLDSVIKGFNYLIKSATVFYLFFELPISLAL